MSDLSPNDPGPPDAASTDQRVRRLEEAFAFAQHDTESLTAQLLDVDARLRALAAKLARLEDRVARADTPKDEPGTAADGAG